MQPEERPDGLVVATPERVAFEYTVAGLGSRFMAQAIDVLILMAVFLVLTIAVALLGAFASGGNLFVLIYVILTFALFLLYFPVLEGVWGGQTVGKRVVRLRVLGDRGEPVTVTQVAIRNLLRIVDFLPFFYGVGIVTLFIQGGSKRLGDFAAGTVVVRDRERIRLQDLVGEAPPAPVMAPQPAPSIWAQPLGPGVPAASPPAPVFSAVTPYEDAARRMPVDLRRFVVAYGGRRHQLAAARRQQLADQVTRPLTELLPGEVGVFGSLAILDGLASLVYTPPVQTSPLPAPTNGLPPPSSQLPPARTVLPPSV